MGFRVKQSLLVMKHQVGVCLVRSTPVEGVVRTSKITTRPYTVRVGVSGGTIESARG